MWEMITGIVAFAAAIGLKAFDLFSEGRGALARRSIKADLELLSQLPDEVRQGPGGEALVDRIELALLTFGNAAAGRRAEPSESDGSDAQPLLDFKVAVGELERKILTVLMVILGAVLLASYVVWPPKHVKFAWSDLVSIPIAFVAAAAVDFVVHIVATRVVKAQWRKAGRELPPNV